jgi:hypothetical protein
VLFDVPIVEEPKEEVGLQVPPIVHKYLSTGAAENGS